MTVLGCVQSSYLPRPGYFHIVAKSDVFVFHDDIQYTNQDWRNRNRIKTVSGPKWITVPVQRASTRGTIDAVRIDNERGWASKHWRMISEAYRRASYFPRYGPILEEVLGEGWEYLGELSICLIRRLSYALGIRTEFLHSSRLGLAGHKTERLIQMCQRIGATRYVSGPSARAYIESQRFADIGVALEYMDYQYPAYPQLHGDFVPALSIIDLLFNCGERSPRFV